MQLNEILGLRVIDAAGSDIGRVADVRLVQDGALLTSMQLALRVDGLIVVEHRATRLLGYERHVGPAVLRRLVHSRLGQVWYLPWDNVDQVTDSKVHARSGREDLQAMEELARF
jgi:sporulation protein YlmC with PRC-barrel domain